MSELRPIIPEQHEAIIEQMNTLLASALHFNDIYKRYHWLVTGPHFQPLHELFDDHMETLEHEIDDFGERVRILGGEPIWDPRKYPDRSKLPQPDESKYDDLAIAREAFEMEARHGDALRSAANAFEDDLATQDLVIEYLRQHEKQAWFLREFVRKVSVGEYREDVME